MDSDYDIEEEMGSKKVVPHKRRSKNASSAPISHQPSPHKHRWELSPSSSSSSSTPQPLSCSRGDGGDDDSDRDEEEQDRDGSDDEVKEEEEGNEEVESTNEGLEYNSRVVVYRIYVMSVPKNRKSWRADHFWDFHEACDLKQFS